MIKTNINSMMPMITPNASNNVIPKEKAKKWCNMPDMTTIAIVS